MFFLTIRLKLWSVAVRLPLATSWIGTKLALLRSSVSQTTYEVFPEAVVGSEEGQEKKGRGEPVNGVC